MDNGNVRGEQMRYRVVSGPPVLDYLDVETQQYVFLQKVFVTI